MPRNHEDIAKSWRDAMLPQKATIQEVIAALNTAGLKIVLIVDDCDRLIGTISDGDIRRGLLRGLQLADSALEVVHRKPLVVPAGIGYESVRLLMVANHIPQIPVVDEQGRVIGIHLWETISAPAPRKNSMVIMAGGIGSRLRPHTESCPKPMLLVGGKPMLEHIIERAKIEGFSHFIVSVRYLAHMIEEYFGDGDRWGVAIEYLREDNPLGTAGALALMSPRPDAAFVVTNGDVLTDIRYGELLDFHERHAATATMAVRLHEWQHPFGVVQIQGVEIVGFEEKPIARTHINAGIYVLDPNALSLIDPGVSCDMPTLFERVKAMKLRTVAYPMHEPWLDVGRPDDWTKANASLSNKDNG